MKDFDVMSISNEMSMRIAKLIADYPKKNESASPELRRLAAKNKVLPLLLDMGGVLTISEDGEIRSFVWDDLVRGQLETDLRIRNLALFQGSKKYPELKDLIVRPEDARVCWGCGGTGIDPYAEKLNADNIVCYCGGLGWIP